MRSTSSLGSSAKPGEAVRVGCGVPSPHPLCRLCQARFQPASPPDPGQGRCPVCGQVLLAEARYCIDCSAQTWSFPSLDGLFSYQDPGAELLRLYKFGGLAALARSWATAAAVRLIPAGPLVPVPPLRRNLWRRGWDPVQSFTRALGRSTGLPVWKLLVRRSSLNQKTLDRSGRLENARRAYTLPRSSARLLGRKTPKVVWLIDDVVTTGATVEACSRLLKDAGAAEVRVLCVGLH